MRRLAGYISSCVTMTNKMTGCLKQTTPNDRSSAPSMNATKGLTMANRLMSQLRQTNPEPQRLFPFQYESPILEYNDDKKDAESLETESP